MNFIVQNYINKITINDVINFANKNNIILNQEEANIIYFHLKNNYQQILNGNPNAILLDLKNKLPISKYNKIENLYKLYSSQYSNFLRP